MKPFDLEAAKAGAPICLADGTPARLICWDRKGSHPLVVLVQSHTGGSEELCAYRLDGDDGAWPKRELRMASVKREGWVNIYSSRVPEDAPPYTHSQVYPDENTARSKAGKQWLATVHVEWEE